MLTALIKLSTILADLLKMLKALSTMMMKVIGRSDDTIDRADRINYGFDGIISHVDEIIDRADGISYLLAVLMKLSIMLMKLSDVLMSCHIFGNYWPR